MKRNSLIAGALIILSTGTVNAKQVTETEFVAAKAQLAYSYQVLENSGLQLQLAFEQDAGTMTVQEQAAIIALGSDLELGKFIVKENLALFTLQSVQVSTPPKARIFLIDSCLDTLEFLDGIQERLNLRTKVVISKKVKNIVAEGLDTIEQAKGSIVTLKKFLEKK